MSKKNSPKFPPLAVRFLPAFVNMYYIKRTAAVSFCLSYCLFVTLYIKNDKSFPHAVFCKSSVHMSMFSVNKILFLITGSDQNNTIFPPTCPKLMKIAQKLTVNKVWIPYLEFLV